jgi:hypothetical protein
MRANPIALGAVIAAPRGRARGHGVRGRTVERWPTRRAAPKSIDISETTRAES